MATLYTTEDILEALGYPEEPTTEAEKKARKTAQARLYQLRKGQSQLRKRSDGTYLENPTVIAARLEENKHWIKKGISVRYTERGRTKVLEIFKEWEKAKE